MIVSDNNALNSYLKTPPYFGDARGVNAIFEIAPPRQVPSVIQDRETEHEVRWAEGRRQGADDRQRARRRAAGRHQPAPSSGRQAVVYSTLPELHLPRAGQQEIDPGLSSQARIRTQLAHSGYLPRQLVIAGGHAFDVTAQARATLNVGKVYRQRV